MGSTKKNYHKKGSLATNYCIFSNNEFQYENLLILFRMGLFWPAHGCGQAKKLPLPKICHTYSTMMKLGTLIPYLKKFKKYINQVMHHPLSSADSSIFFPPKSANFAMSSNTDIEFVLIHYF